MKFLDPKKLEELQTLCATRKRLYHAVARFKLPGPNSPGCNTAKKLQAERRLRRTERQQQRVTLRDIERQIANLASELVGEAP